MLAAVVQLTSTPDVEKNLATTERLVRDAALRGAKLVVVPENFSHLGPEREKIEIAETIPGDGPILGRMRALARETKTHLVLGGMAERSDDPDRVYNACVVLAPDGAVQAVYRKIHLFDVNIEGGVTVEESRTFKPGTDIVVTDSPFGPLGLSICYDLRFAELYRELVRRGALAVVVPAAFTLYTGKDHWLPLCVARAIENQCYVLAPNQHGPTAEGHSDYGHSSIVDPWGTVIARASDGEGVITAEIDLGHLARVRSELPCLEHVRLLD